MINERYRITVEFTIIGEDDTEAESFIKEVVAAGLLALLDPEDPQPIESFDVIDTEPAELP
jgi:hypothetical protein